MTVLLGAEEVGLIVGAVSGVGDNLSPASAIAIVIVVPSSSGISAMKVADEGIGATVLVVMLVGDVT
jgi:hypothetical protein